MKYYQIKFTLTPRTDDFCDVLAALLADEGFETFVPTDEGMEAYVQQHVYDADALRGLVDGFPLPGVTLSYDVVEAEDRDWNEAWEAEGFEPIVVDTRLGIHDTLHALPHAVDYDIRINPRQAFGTGTHPTTRTLLTTLLDMDMAGRKVVDAGCGTGVLGILCRMKGARGVFAYDIDSWSVDNTLTNIALNDLPSEDFEVIEGDASTLADVHDVDLFIANIFREIIIADMPRFAATLAPKAQMLLSGFYDDDVAAVLECASAYGLSLRSKTICEGWTILVLER